VDDILSRRIDEKERESGRPPWQRKPVLRGKSLVAEGETEEGKVVWNRYRKGKRAEYALLKGIIRSARKKKDRRTAGERGDQAVSSNMKNYSQTREGQENE